MDLCLDKKKYKRDKDLIVAIITNMGPRFTLPDVYQITDKSRVTNKRVILNLLDNLCESGNLIYIDGIFYHPENQI